MNPNTERDERVRRDRKPPRVWITWDDAYPWETPETGGDEYVRVELLNDAATRMREACVDAIKTLRTTPHGAAYNNAINDAIHKVESLMLEGEQKQ